MAIIGFRYKGRERFLTRGTTAAIQASHVKGDRRGTWAVQVSGNWRVTFRFIGPDVSHVDYEDSHQ